MIDIDGHSLRPHTRTRRAVAAAVAVLLGAAVPAETVAPGKLLIYYGFPSSLNYGVNGWDLELVIPDLARYDYVVLGDGLAAPEHPDHANTRAIVDSPLTDTFFFGYVDLGVNTQNLSDETIRARIDDWHELGADGVLLDDFGYDFGTDRARQNAAVDHAHALGLPVCANGFRVEDVFGTVVSTATNANGDALNPDGAGPRLDDRDFYLYESHQITSGAGGPFVATADWQAKAEALLELQSAIGFRVLSITTTAAGVDGFRQEQLDYAWYSALLFGHAATGWGESQFSCCNQTNGLAPFRDRPAVDVGTMFTGPVHSPSPGVFERPTDGGVIRVDANSHTAGFEPAAVTAVFETTDAGLPSAFLLPQNHPNPFNAATTIRFVLPLPSQVELSVYSLSGQRVATLAVGHRPAGVFALSWDGRDTQGRAVGTGVYVYRLEAGLFSHSRRMLLLR